MAFKTSPWDLRRRYTLTGIALSVHPSHDYGSLSEPFIGALKLWKPQNASFLDLPGELRNHIYSLLIPDTSEYYTEVVDLGPDLSAALPVVTLIFTCRQLQRELLPIYFRTINLRLSYNCQPSPDEAAKLVDKQSLRIMTIYERLNPSLVDHLRSLRLHSGPVRCNIEITGLKAVHVELSTFGPWITSSALTEMSIVLRNQIIHSLVNSPTGLLGIRHLSIAFQANNQIAEWWEWKQQKEEWTEQKVREAPWRISDVSCGGAYYSNHLQREAEEEGMPRLILATASPQDAAEMYA